MKDRKSIFSTLHNKMLDAGFVFEKRQPTHFQKRKEYELKFIHPKLVSTLEKNGHKVRGKKFYIKPLSDHEDSDIGLVNGRTSPLHSLDFFQKANGIDTHDDAPAWINRGTDKSLDMLLFQIKDYLGIINFFPNEINTNLELYEGSKKVVTVNSYERNAQARELCIAHHGYTCKVCSFDFYEIYGEIGKNFIHVHHITPLHTINEQYKINPIQDLIPVCPNCHAMLHRKIKGTEPTVEELKKIIKNNR